MARRTHAVLLGTVALVASSLGLVQNEGSASTSASASSSTAAVRG